MRIAAFFAPDSAGRKYSDEPLEGAAGIDQLLPLVCEVLLKTFLNKTNNSLLKIKTFFSLYFIELDLILIYRR